MVPWIAIYPGEKFRKARKTIGQICPIVLYFSWRSPCDWRPTIHCNVDLTVFQSWWRIFCVWECNLFKNKRKRKKEKNIYILLFQVLFLLQQQEATATSQPTGLDGCWCGGKVGFSHYLYMVYLPHVLAALKVLTVVVLQKKEMFLKVCLLSAWKYCLETKQKVSLSVIEWGGGRAKQPTLY